MAFPTTGLLDDFNRANEIPITTNWTTPLDSGGVASDLFSNSLGWEGTGGAVYDLAQFGPDCEAWATIVAVPVADGLQTFLLTNLTGLGASNTAYRVSWVMQTGSWYITIGRIDSGSFTAFVFEQGPVASLADGHKIGMSVVGGLITAWHNPAGTWASVWSAQDPSTALGVGYIGCQQDWGGTSFDDFGGGTIVQSILPGDNPPVGFLGRGAGW